MTPTNDTVTITIDNAFPLEGEDGVDLCADFVLTYQGSIPVIVNAVITGSEDLTENNGLNDLELLDAYATVSFYMGDDDEGTPITGPIQMHEDDMVYAVLCIDIPEDDDYMNLSASFTATITAIQWNEWEGDPPVNLPVD